MSRRGKQRNKIFFKKQGRGLINYFFFSFIPFSPSSSPFFSFFFLFPTTTTTTPFIIYSSPTALTICATKHISLGGTIHKYKHTQIQGNMNTGNNHKIRMKVKIFKKNTRMKPVIITSDDDRFFFFPSPISLFTFCLIIRQGLNNLFPPMLFASSPHRPSVLAFIYCHLHFHLSHFIFPFLPSICTLLVLFFFFVSSPPLPLIHKIAAYLLFSKKKKTIVAAVIHILTY